MEPTTHLRSAGLNLREHSHDGITYCAGNSGMTYGGGALIRYVRQAKLFLRELILYTSLRIEVRAVGVPLFSC